MINELCDSGTMGFLGDFGVWSWIAVILNLVFWVGLIVGLALLVVWAIRRARDPASTGPYATGQPTAKEILQARYARGEITREKYELKKQVIG
ncbi:MAG TPA: hypothetical protein VFZ76_12540 [Anaerolineales bacterium]